jgi:hypothetical protein
MQLRRHKTESVRRLVALGLMIAEIAQFILSQTLTLLARFWTIEYPALLRTRLLLPTEVSGSSHDGHDGGFR